MNNIPYPSIEEVSNASHIQLASWHRYLNSPGASAVGKENFEEIIEKEAKVLDLIEKKLQDFGGITVEISKKIGWEKYQDFIK